MAIVTLYKYVRDGGGITVSPVKPDKEYSLAYRLIADEGKTLTQDSISFTPCVDTDTVGGWYEVQQPLE